MRKKLALLVVVGLIAAMPAVPAGAKKAAKPMVVGKDAADDWGSEAGVPAPAGMVLGQELVEAAIGMGDPKTLNLIIKTAFLPPNGGWPEITRYVWSFTVDGEYREVDGKWLNYSRGACDPTSGQCPPPRDPGQQPFLVRGNCRTDQVVICDELGIVKGAFDAGSSTITIPVPLELIGAKAGSKIGPAVSLGSYGGAVVAIPSAFYSVANMPYDYISVTKTFTVPR